MRVSKDAAELAKRTAEVQAQAFRIAAQPLIDAARSVCFSARASAPIEGVRHKRVKASKLDTLMECLLEAEQVFSVNSQEKDA